MLPAQLTLADAAADDADAIARLLIQSKEGSWPADSIEPYDRDFEFARERWRSYIEEGSTAQKALGDGFVILARMGDELAGFAAYHHTRRWNCDAELQSMYMLPAFQGRQIGTALLREIFRRLRAGGSQSLCVGFDPRNPYKQFYYKHGAVEIDPHWAMWPHLPDTR